MRETRGLGFDWASHSIADRLSDSRVDFGQTRYRFTELWTGETGDTAQPYAMTVPAHGVVMVRLQAK